MTSMSVFSMVFWMQLAHYLSKDACLLTETPSRHCDPGSPAARTSSSPRTALRIQQRRRNQQRRATAPVLIRVAFVLVQALLLLAFLSYAFLLIVIGDATVPWTIPGLLRLEEDADALSSDATHGGESVMQVICADGRHAAIFKAGIAFLAGAILNCKTFFKIPTL